MSDLIRRSEAMALACYGCAIGAPVVMRTDCAPLNGRWHTYEPALHSDSCLAEKLLALPAAAPSAVDVAARALADAALRDGLDDVNCPHVSSRILDAFYAYEAALAAEKGEA